MRVPLRPALVGLVMLGALFFSSLAYNVEHLRWGLEEPAQFEFYVPERNESASVDANLAKIVRYALIASAVAVGVVAVVVAVWKEERSRLARTFLSGLVQTLVVLLLTTVFLAFVIYGGAVLQGIPPPRQFSVDINLADYTIILGVGGIAAALVFIYIVACRRTGVEHMKGLVIARDEAAALIQEAVKDIQAGGDLRGTVMRCYAGMVNLFEERGVQMRKEMTPREFQTVVMAILGLEEESVRVLTALFEEARYSTHEVSEPHKEMALANLEKVRKALEAENGER